MNNRYLITYQVGRLYFEVWMQQYFHALAYVDCLLYNLKPDHVRMWGRHPQRGRWSLIVNR